MKKEIAKNCILSLLIFVCVFLFYKIWFSEKLWSSDYNFFAILWGNSQISADTSSSIEDILRPQKLIYSGGGKRFVSTKGDAEFEDYYDEIKKVLGKITQKDSKFTTANEEELLSAIKTSSVIVDFGTVFGGEIGKFLGTYLPCDQVRDVVISLNDLALGKPVIYIFDRANGKILKTSVDVPLADLKASFSEHIEKNAEGSIPFAFELGFNKSKVTENSEISQDILLNSNILIGLNDISAPGIVITPPTSIDLSSSQANMLLRQFNMKKSSARKYIESNDNLLYAEGDATLKISPAGKLEYTAVTSGPMVYDPNSENALSTAAGNIFTYVRTVFRCFDIDAPELQISSDLVNLSKNTEEITINIDYYLNSIPVMAWDGTHAITVTLKNGRLVSYSQQVCMVDSTDTLLTTGNMLKAVDGLYATLPQGSKVTVSDLFVVYTKENILSWCAKLSGQDELIIIGGEGTV